MRVLLVSIGTAGDLLPFIALGKALRERGHHVTVLGNGYYQDVVEKEALDFVAVCSAAEHLKRTRQRSTWDLHRSFREGGRNLLEDMPRTYEAVAAHYVPGETVVAAAGMMFGARIAQEKLGLPLATVHLYPLCFRSAHDNVLWPRWMPMPFRRALFFFIEREIDRRFGVEINAFRSRLGLPPASRILSHWWNSPQLVLGLFPDWLSRPQPDWPANTLLAGFPLHDALQPFTSEQSLDEFLSAGEPPLVFSHSSAVDDAGKFFEDSVTVTQALGRRAVLLTPHAEQVPEPLPAGVRHYPFVPHSSLLPRAAALVHHGGIGTAFQALAAGIPQLIVPVFLDQPDNCRRLTQLGVAATVRPGSYHPREVCRHLDYLLRSAEVATRCREYAARCREGTAAETACVALDKLFASANGAAAPTAQPRRVNVRQSIALACSENGLGAVSPRPPIRRSVMTTVREASLPDGTPIFAVRPQEVGPLYQQVQEYCRHGIRVQEGDVVFDVGANIGLFALWLRQSVSSNITVYSFEPIPPVFEALQHNANRFDPQNWKVFPCGLGCRSGTATFAYFSRVTAMSSVYPDTSPEAVVALRNTLLRNGHQLPKGLRWMGGLSGFLLRPCIDYLIRRAFVTEKVQCPMRTVSEVIREQQVSRVDLLKIDVEKAEWDVLEGIEPTDWGIIRQVAVEVHDLDGRLAKVKGLLNDNGFQTIVVEQEPLFKGTEIYNLYALRTQEATLT